MKLVYYQDAHGNFGDDLNAVLWRNLLPKECWEVEDAVLLGIGTIFDEGRLSAETTGGKRVFVCGSGAGYGPVPRLWPNKYWTIGAVRGPLTAELIGRPEAAITDGAALIAAIPGLVETCLPRDRVVFMPHHFSITSDAWVRAADKAGLEFIDPRWPVSRVLERISRARLVVTEAMHGAIVADTLRIPWVPVVTSARILPFKWLDWCASIEVDYTPVFVPSCSAWQALSAGTVISAEFRRQRKAPTHSLSRADVISLVEAFRRSSARPPSEGMRGKRSFAGKVARRAGRRAASLFDGLLVGRLARGLAEATAAVPVLSSDEVFTDRLGRLKAALERIARAILER